MGGELAGWLLPSGNEMSACPSLHPRQLPSSIPHFCFLCYFPTPVPGELPTVPPAFFFFFVSRKLFSSSRTNPRIVLARGELSMAPLLQNAICKLICRRLPDIFKTANHFFVLLIFVGLLSLRMSLMWRARHRTRHCRDKSHDHQINASKPEGISLSC